MKDIQNTLALLKERNIRVEADKAWETSVFRKIVIFVLTYIVASIWLVVTEGEQPFLNACVPAVGWIFSTLTIAPVKRWWIKNNTKK